MEFVEACKNGDLDQIEKLYDTVFKDSWSLQHGFLQVCKKGYIKIVKWFLSRLYSNYELRMLQRTNHNIFSKTCTSGQFKVAKMLFSKNITGDFNKQDLFIKVCEKGHFYIAKWLYCLDNESFKDKILKNAFTVACAEGHIDIYKWLHSLKIDYSSCIEYTFATTLQKGQLETAKWLYDLYAKLIKYDEIFLDACKSKKLEIIEWIYSILPDDKCIRRKCAAYGFIWCCGYADIAIVKYVDNLGIIEDRLDRNGMSAFANACANNRFDTAEFLSKRYVNTRDVFEKTCENGHLEMAKWLHKNNMMYHVKIDLVFESVCEKGYFELAEWLYNKFVINNCSNSFKKACENGRLEIAKWLKCKDETLYCTCDMLKKILKSGHYNIIKWLLETDIDIFVKNNKIFTQLDLYILGYSEETVLLLNSDNTDKICKCINDLDSLDDIVVHTACYENNITLMNLLCAKFKNLYIEIVDNKITNYKFSVTTKPAKKF